MTNFKMSPESRTLKIYNLRADTKEYIGAGDVYIPPNTGLPANCTLIEPPEAGPGQVAVFNDAQQQWEVVEDHRGKTVYDTATGKTLCISRPGALPDDVTTLPPEGEFHRWGGAKWIKDDEAERAAKIRDAEREKQKLLQEIMEKTQLWQTWLSLGIISEADKKSLREWMLYAQKVEATDTSELPVRFPDKPLIVGELSGAL